MSGLTDEEQDAVIAAANRHGFPHVKVACPLHGIGRAKDKSLVECALPECQNVMEERRQAVRAASAETYAITEAGKAEWRAWRVGDAKAKRA